MKKALLIILVLAAAFSSVSYGKTVDVSVAINDKADSVVKDAARKKAIWQAALDYPALVSGVESMDSSGQFKSEITALTAGAIELETIREEWDRDNNEYTLVAKASVNQSVSLEMIKGVQGNLELQKRLKRVYQDLDKAIRADSAVTADFEQGMDDIRLVSSVIYRRDSYEASLAAKEAMEKHFRSTVLRKVVQPLYDNVTFELYDFDERAVLYRTNLFSLDRAVDLSEFGKHCSVRINRERNRRFSIYMTGCTLHPWYEDTPFAEDMTLPYTFVTTGFLKRRSGHDVFKFNEYSTLWGDAELSYTDMVETPELVYDNFAIGL